MGSLAPRTGHSAQHRFSARWRGSAAVACLAATLAIPGCSPSDSPNGYSVAALQDLQLLRAAADATGERTGVDPCALLEPREVEVALGKLGTVPRAANARDGDGRRCIYQGTDLRSIEVTLLATGGTAWMRHSHAAVPERKGWLFAPGRTSMSGPWDAAALEGCCRIDVMLGDSVISIDVLGSRATLEQAANLAGRAVRRLDAPLPPARPGTTKPVEIEQPSFPHATACEMLDRREVETLLGPLQAEPVGIGDATSSSCTYRYAKPLPGLPLTVGTIKSTVLWRGGYRALRKALAAPAGDGTFEEASTDLGSSLASPSVQAALGPDRILAATRDVLVTVESVPLLGRTEHVEELASALLSHIR